MNKPSIGRILSFLLFLFLLYGIQGCAPPPRPMGAPPPPPPAAPLPPPPAEITRSAEIENYFRRIASAEDVMAANEYILEVLEMVESPALTLEILVYDGSDVSRAPEISIREYLELIKEAKRYTDRIDWVDYNSQGKINKIRLIRRIETEQRKEHSPRPIAPGAPPPSADVSRSASLENEFRAIANATNHSIANEHILNVLRMCSSPDVTLIISFRGENNTQQTLTTSVRPYLETLREGKKYAERIDGLDYDSNGKISLVRLTRY